MTDSPDRPQEPQEAPSAWLPRQLRGIAAELLAGTDFGDVQQAAALIESQAAALTTLRQRLDALQAEHYRLTKLLHCPSLYSGGTHYCPNCDNSLYNKVETP